MNKETKSPMSEGTIFKTVLIHCLGIIISPILSFFVFKLYVFDALLGLESMQSNLYSAFISVIVLHLALGNFIYRAYFNTETISGFDKLVKED